MHSTESRISFTWLMYGKCSSINGILIHYSRNFDKPFAVFIATLLFYLSILPKHDIS
jgi:hypothetical protein